MCLERTQNIHIRKLPVSELRCWKIYHEAGDSDRIPCFIKMRDWNDLYPLSRPTDNILIGGVSAFLDWYSARYTWLSCFGNCKFKIGTCLLKGNIYTGSFKLIDSYAEAVHGTHVMASEWGGWLS